MKVVVTFPIPPPAKNLLSQHAELVCWDSEDRIPKGILADWLETADGLLTTLNCSIDEGLLASTSRLRVISTVSVGVDHIDVQ